MPEGKFTSFNLIWFRVQIPTCENVLIFSYGFLLQVFAHKGNLLRHMAMHDPDHKLTQEMLEADGTQEVVITDNTDQNTILVTNPVEETPRSSKTAGGRAEIPVQTVQLVQVVDESGQNTTQILLQMEEGHQQVINSSSLAAEDIDDDDEITPKKEEFETPKKRGRRPKKQPQPEPEPEPQEELDLDMTVETKQDDEHPDEVEEEEEEEEVEVKQSPRTRKNVQAAAAATPRTPRGRGRPRKAAQQAEAEEEKEEVTPEETPSKTRR